MARIAQPGARLVLLVARERHALLVEFAQSPHPASALTDGQRPRVSGCVRLAPRGHVAACVARAAWLSPRGPSRSSPRASGSLCSSRLRCHAAASGRARPLARAHCEVLGRALQREPKQSRSTSEFSIAAGQASNIAD